MGILNLCDLSMGFGVVFDWNPILKVTGIGRRSTLDYCTTRLCSISWTRGSFGMLCVRQCLSAT